MNPISRRSFVKTSTVTAISAAALAAMGTNFAHAAGSATMKVGLVGCGGRGTGAAHDSASGSGGIKIVSIGDLFKDRLDECRKNLADLGDKVELTDDRCFVGWDA